MAGTITIQTDRGPAPALRPSDSTRSAKLLAQFQAWQHALAPLVNERNQYVARRQRGEFLPYPAFTRLRDLDRIINTSRKARTFAARMKALTKANEQAA